MKIAVPKEVYEDERRVALVPGAVGKLVKGGYQVVVEAGAGERASYPDEEYKTAGADIASSLDELYKDATVILKVRPPKEHPSAKKHEIDLYPQNVILISYLEVLREPEIANKLAKQNVTAFALETVPRISRAQAMDALSSQASAAGYKAVLIAAEAIHKYFPMLTTAAGTIRPARVLVLGAGVAGLQAIATAKRLGSTVEAFDIRKATKEEVQSLGAKFIEVDLGESGEAEGGYAKELSEEAKKREHEVLREHMSQVDVIITTAAVPGKKAPVLVTEDMLDVIKPGSVIVDMAVEQGGNVVGSKPGERVERNGVTIIGPINLPSQMAIHTSQLYARNVVTLLNHLIKEGQISLDFEDEITKGACITHEGQVVNERIKDLLS